MSCLFGSTATVGGCARFLDILQIIPIFPSVCINVTGFQILNNLSFFLNTVFARLARQRNHVEVIMCASTLVQIMLLLMFPLL